MPFARPSLSDLIARVDLEVQTRLGVGPLLRRGMLGTLARVMAGIAHALHGRLAWNVDQLFVDTADGANLERHGSIRGVPRKPAAFALGKATFTGLETTIVAEKTRVQRSDGEEFETLRTGTITGGSALISIRAILAGVDANTPALTVLTLVSPVSGLDPNVTVDSSGISGGADEETDDELRERLLQVIRTPPQGGSAADYEIWAKQVAGVTRAWGLPLHLGPGTVGVTFVVDNDPISIIPNASKVAEVQTYIDARRPATAVVTVFAPGTKALDITLTITPDTQAVRDAVKASLADLVDRETNPGAVLLLSHIDEAISLAEGEEDHTITVINGAAPANVPAAPGEIIVLGVVTFV